MKTVVVNLMIVVLAWMIGSAINIGLVNLGPYVFPIPEGADITSTEGLKDSIALFEPVNFIFPYLGHILGTLIGALFAARFGLSKNMTLAFIVGILFLIGGIIMIQMVGGPSWFTVLDLISYLPAAFIGGKIGLNMKRKRMMDRA